MEADKTVPMTAKPCLCFSVPQTRQVLAKLLTTLQSPTNVREKECKLFPFNGDAYRNHNAVVPSVQPECNSLTQRKPEFIALALEYQSSVRKTSGVAQVLYKPPFPSNICLLFVWSVG